LGFAVGRDFALATMLALLSFIGRFDDLYAVFLLLDGGKFFGFWLFLFFVIFEFGVVLLCGGR